MYWKMKLIMRPILEKKFEVKEKIENEKLKEVEII